MRLFSLLSLFSYFAAVERCVPTYGVKGEGQPTRCGHTLTRCPLPGLARGSTTTGSPPSNPPKIKRQNP